MLMLKNVVPIIFYLLFFFFEKLTSVLVLYKIPKSVLGKW